MNRKKVYVERNEDRKVIRIFKGRPPANIWWGCEFKATAVSEVRQQVFARANGQCDYCGEVITYQTGHMHEKIKRSQLGEISLDNCVALCAECHRKEHPGIGKGVS